MSEATVFADGKPGRITMPEKIVLPPLTYAQCPCHGAVIFTNDQEARLPDDGKSGCAQCGRTFREYDKWHCIPWRAAQREEE